MAKDKKSFIAYCEWIETFEELEDAEAGKLVKHLFRYVNDLNPVTDDKTVKLCFIQFKQSLKRDLKKYEVYIDKQKENGAKGGRPKKTQITQPFIEEPKKADSVNVSDNDILTIPDISTFMLYLKDYLADHKRSDEYSKIRNRMIDTYNAWKLNDWKDGNDKKIKNWKTKAVMQLRYIK